MEIFNPENTIDYNPLEDPSFLDVCQPMDPINVSDIYNQPLNLMDDGMLNGENRETNPPNSHVLSQVTPPDIQGGSITSSNATSSRPENRTESIKWRRERKRYDHEKYRIRKNEAVAKLNSVLDKLLGKQKRTLIEALHAAAQHLGASEE